MANKSAIRLRIRESIEAKQALLQDEVLLEALERLVDAVVNTYQNGGKVLFCGNGGSAADAQHLSAELSARFYLDRKPLYAEALHVNTSYLTATANDYDFTQIFARLVQAKGKPGDVLIGLSTSGNSPNIIEALKAGKEAGMITVGFTGQKPGQVDPFCEILLKVPNTDTPRIQECHLLLGHILCEQVEAALFG